MNLQYIHRTDHDLYHLQHIHRTDHDLDHLQHIHRTDHDLDNQDHVLVVMRCAKSLIMQIPLGKLVCKSAVIQILLGKHYLNRAHNLYKYVCHGMSALNYLK